MSHKSQDNAGLTLVELLVAISVLTIIVALIVPQLRLANKERNIREAARVVGSAFSAARDRAVAEGGAGIIIERNPNFVSPTVDGNGVLFAGTRLLPIRFKRPFVGDFDGDFVAFYTFTPNNGDPQQLRAMIPLPLGHDEDPVVFAGDEISVGNLTYRIGAVFDEPREIIIEVDDPPQQLFGRRYDDAENMLDMLVLRLDWDDNPDHSNPPENFYFDTASVDYITGQAAPRTLGGAASRNMFSLNEIQGGAYNHYSIKRLSLDRIATDQSKAINLPEGYVIDMRYSGPLDAADLDGDVETHTLAGLSRVVPGHPLPDHLKTRFFILFDEQGALSEIMTFYWDQVANDLALTRQFTAESLYLFINEYDPNQILPNVDQQALELLSGEDNLWLTIGINGGANIGYNVAPTPAVVGDMILQSRTLSSERTSARQ